MRSHVVALAAVILGLGLAVGGATAAPLSGSAIGVKIGVEDAGIVQKAQHHHRWRHHRHHWRHHHHRYRWHHHHHHRWHHHHRRHHHH